MMLDEPGIGAEDKALVGLVLVGVILVTVVEAGV